MALRPDENDAGLAARTAPSASVRSPTLQGLSMQGPQPPAVQERMQDARKKTAKDGGPNAYDKFLAAGRGGGTPSVTRHNASREYKGSGYKSGEYSVNSIANFSNFS